jgi:hypothetical protein
VVATCAHVLAAPEKMKQGWLVAATDEDVLLPVQEVLAMDAGLDCAILRVKCEQPLTPLPLREGQGTPGDPVWCLSDPSGKRGYYSEGIISRFVRRPFLRKKEREKLPEGSEVPRPVWLETTVEWAPGSSGSAILDVAGNVIAHVSEIQPVLEDIPLPVAAAGAKKKDNATSFTPGTYMVFHQAITAGELLKLIRRTP